MHELHLTFPGETKESVILFGQGIFSAIAEHLERDFPDRVIAVVSDDTVAQLYGARLVNLLTERGRRAELFTFAAGEASKSRAVKDALEDAMFHRGLGRDSLVIALGGGVTGDLAGFVAATYCRGVPVVQVPTTVLAMADSSVGGKTGIDIPAGKNLVGAFHQPARVFMDPQVLATLPEREIRAGLVEVVKHGLIRDRGLFRLIREHLPRLLRPAEEPELFNRILFRSCSIKADVVREDEREGGLRQILNFGHTIGHALESISGWKLLHGEAVSLGIVAALELSCRRGLVDRNEAGEAVELLRDLGTPVRTECEAESVLAVMRRDKKVRQNAIRFVLLEGVGRVSGGPPWSVPVPEEEIRQALRALRAPRRDT